MLRLRELRILRGAVLPGEELLPDRFLAVLQLAATVRGERGRPPMAPSLSSAPARSSMLSAVVSPLSKLMIFASCEGPTAPMNCRCVFSASSAWP